MKKFDTTEADDEATIAWLEMMPATPDAEARRAAERRQDRLIKPRGALGRLEDVAILLAAHSRSAVDDQSDRTTAAAFPPSSRVTCFVGTAAWIW